MKEVSISTTRTSRCSRCICGLAVASITFRRSHPYFASSPSRENILAILETLPLQPGEKQQRLGALLGELGLTSKAKAKAYTLSGGERRRAEITRALVTSPSFMLLDEPFAGIDPIAVGDIQKIIQHLKSRGIGILITDHNVRETLQITDRAYIMNEGRIFRAGSPSELATDEEVRRVYLGDEFRLN